MSPGRSAWVALLLAALPACGSHEPLDDLPAGALLGGDARALVRILEAADGLPGTPLARAAEAWRTRLADCTSFVARTPRASADDLLDALECHDPAELPEPVARLRGDADLVFVLPLGERGRLAGSVRVAPDGSVGLAARLALPDPGAATLLLPASTDPPGPPALRSDAALVHARVRADASGLASLVSEGSDADRMFRLRSELFAGALLDGTWELAVYLPRPGRLMPPVALGLGVRSASAAAAALEKLVAELQATWPVHRTPFSIAGREGGCLLDLRVLPELAPCFVLDGERIVVGWNPDSLHAALAGGGPDDPRRSDVADSGAEGGWTLHLGRLADADELLRRAAAPEAPATRFDYGWQTLHVRMSPDAGAWQLSAELAGRTRS
jgi:hypothetical protein